MISGIVTHVQNIRLPPRGPIADRVIDQYSMGGLESLEPRDRIFFLIWAYGALLDNGGHASFFYNSGADNYSETLEALKQLDLALFAELLKRAGTLLFNGDVPRDMMAWNAIINDLPEDDLPMDDELTTLDDAFFSNGGGNKALDALEAWYTRQN